MSETIGGLWNRFYNEGVYEQLDKRNPAALEIYTDYESNETAGYTVMVACEANPDVLPAGTSVRTIPAGRYARFEVHGEMVSAVSAFWEELWKTDLPRSFRSDFEEYTDKTDGECTVLIYIGLKSIVESNCGLRCGECAYREQAGCPGCAN